MIRPNVRASFGRREAEILLGVAGPTGETRLREEGIDVLLDDASLVKELLQRGGIELAPARLIFYLLVRHALLEREIHDRQLADYTAAVLLEFGRLGGSVRAPAEALPDTIYLVDILQEIERARGEREFALRAHLGNMALWLGGVFPDFIARRVQRRGAPPMSYYDEVGAEWAVGCTLLPPSLRCGRASAPGGFGSVQPPPDVESSANLLDSSL